MSTTIAMPVQDWFSQIAEDERAILHAILGTPNKLPYLQVLLADPGYGSMVLLDGVDGPWMSMAISIRCDAEGHYPEITLWVAGKTGSARYEITGNLLLDASDPTRAREMTLLPEVTLLCNLHAEWAVTSIKRMDDLEDLGRKLLLRGRLE